MRNPDNPKTFLIIPVLMLLAGAFALAAQGDMVLLRPVNGNVIESAPNRTITASIGIVGRADMSLDLSPETELPESWRLVVKDSPFRIDPGQTLFRLILFGVPRETPVGTYAVIYRVRSQRTNALISETRFLVTVIPFRELHTEIVETSDPVMAGADYTVRFLVQNRGNVGEDIELDVRSDHDFPVQLSARRFTLEPRAVKVVTAAVETRKQQYRSIHHNLRIRAWFCDHPDQFAETRSSVPVIPSSQWKPDLYHRIPGHFALRQIVTSDARYPTSTQADLVSVGSIDEAGEHRLHLHLRGPDAYNRSYMADHDRIFAQYTNRHFQISAGDEAFELSPLLEYSRYGRGLQIRGAHQQFSAGVLYGKTRWRNPYVEETGAFCQYSMNANHSMRINYLHKAENAFRHHLISGEGAFRILNDLSVDMEYAMQPESGHTAYSLKTHIMKNRFGGGVSLIKADKDFAGYYRNTDFLLANLSVFLKRNLSVYAAYQRDQKVFEVDTIRFTLPYTRNQRFSMRYRPFDKTGLKLSVIDQLRTDRSPEPRFDYREFRTDMDLDQAFYKFNLSLLAEIGETENRIQGVRGNTTNLYAGLRFAPTSRQHYRVFIRSDNNIRYSGNREKRNQLGMSGHLHIFDRTSVSFTYRNNYTPETYFIDRNISEFLITHRFDNGIQVRLQGRQTLLRQTLNRSESAVMLDCRLPFGVPVSKKKQTAVLSGTVCDLHSRMPRKGATVRLNSYMALTDENGRYVFYGLEPGDYYLNIDKGEEMLRDVPASRMPFVFSVQGGENRVIDIHMVPGACVRGRIIFPAEKHASSRNANRRSTIIIEMRKGDEVIRRMTDASGCFLFDDLRPGKWVLKPYAHNLPPHHQYENALIHMDLEPGTDKKVDIRVVPRKRRIQFLQEGGTLQVEEAPW